MIVPEQYTIEMQRALVQASSHAGILNVDVVSFARLAQMVLEYDHPLKKLTEEFGPHTKASFLRDWRISQAEVSCPHH